VQTFRSYGFVHLATLLGVAAAIALFVIAGRAWREQRRGRMLEVAVAMVIILLRVGVFAWNLFPERLSLARSIPLLQICDLAALCSAIALLGGRRWAAAIAYFWGLALSIQGLIQPDLRVGPATLAYWLFWLHHALIVGVAVYLLAVRRFEPGWRDFRIAVTAGLVYVAVVFCIDLALDANYGYLGRRLPAQRTLLDWLGPWPWRVPVVAALGAGVMWLLLVPWLVRRSRQPAAGSATEPSRGLRQGTV
jgi:hypothetical integral membrane protein (TIGR02206 family)